MKKRKSFVAITISLFVIVILLAANIAGYVGSKGENLLLIGIGFLTCSALILGYLIGRGPKD